MRAQAENTNLCNHKIRKEKLMNETVRIIRSSDNARSGEEGTLITFVVGPAYQAYAIVRISNRYVSVPIDHIVKI